MAEEANPENQLGVERVDLLYPADILANGTVIIDTPGVGSTLQHNTEAAVQVLPKSDAALFVISADPADHRGLRRTAAEIFNIPLRARNQT